MEILFRFRREVTIGDEVILEAGDCIPADGKLIECASLKVDESALTGESIAVEKNLDEVAVGTALWRSDEQSILRKFCYVWKRKIQVTAIGMNTEVGKIADLMKNTSEKRTPLQVNLDDFGKKIVDINSCIFRHNIWGKCISGRIYWFSVYVCCCAGSCSDTGSS